MKIDITWEGIDLKVGRVLVDKDGAKYFIVSVGPNQSACWSLYRPADSWVMKPMTAEAMLSVLNDGGFMPKEFA